MEDHIFRATEGLRKRRAHAVKTHEARVEDGFEPSPMPAAFAQIEGQVWAALKWTDTEARKD